MRTLRLKNVIYMPIISAIGGTDTFCYEMGLKYGSDYDITLIFREGDQKMLRKIADVCRVIRYQDGDEIICDTFNFGYRHEIIDHVHAKKYVETFHADYVARGMTPFFDERVTHMFGVSNNTTDTLRATYKEAKNVKTVYNPYTPKKPRKVLNLVSATRMSKAKGYVRMMRFADALDAAGIPFSWLVFTDIKLDLGNPSISVLPNRLDVLDFIANADYLVHLSETEGYSYSINEALCVGTPVIMNDIPVASEQGVVTGETGFILPLDMSEIPVDAIYEGLPPFEYTPRESHYEKVLSKGKAECATDDGVFTVTAVRRYSDIELGRIVERGETLTVARERADRLVELGLVEIVW